MLCPACQNDEPAGSPYCSVCGAELLPAKRATALESLAPPQPPPASPHQKRHTVFDPGPTATPRGVARDPGRDFFADPPPPRQPFNPVDPFLSAARQEAPAVSEPKAAPAVAAWSPAPVSAPVPVPAAPAPAAVPASAPSAPRKAHTIVESGTGTGAPVRGALVEFRGPTDPGRVHPLRAGRNIIGRTADCDVCLEDGRVSAQHAFLFVRQEDASFIDVSSNGSKVEGRALQGEQVSLQHGAALELGGTRLVLLLVPEASLEKVGVR